MAAVGVPRLRRYDPHVGYVCGGYALAVVGLALPDTRVGAPNAPRGQRMWSVLTTAIGNWSRHRSARLGAALAYYSVFSSARSFSVSSPLPACCSGRRLPAAP